jgi:hypothetical protein
MGVIEDSYGGGPGCGKVKRATHAVVTVNPPVPLALAIIPPTSTSAVTVIVVLSIAGPAQTVSALLSGGTT